MKKRIGNLRGKPIIEGDKNLMTPNELHIDSLGKSDNEGGGSNIEAEPVYYFNSEAANMFNMFVSHMKVYDKTKQKYYSVTPHSTDVSPLECFGVICLKCIYLESGGQTTILDYLTAFAKVQNPSMSLLEAKKAAEDMIAQYRITKEEYYEGIEIMTAEQILDTIPQN